MNYQQSTASGQRARIFEVRGMCCASEVGALKREVGPRVGGEGNLAFDLLQGRMTVFADAGQASDEVVLEAVRRAGLEARRWEEAGATSEKEGFWKRHGRAVMTAASAGFLIAAFVTHVLITGSVLAALRGEGVGGDDQVPVAAAVLYALSIAAGVWFVLPKAWNALRALRPDMNLLMTIAVAGAVGIGEWFEAATVAMLFALSLLLESWSVGRARRAVAKLLEASPPVARLRHGEREIEVDPHAVPVGSVIIVRPGERVPLDGEVVAGESDLNQAPITGESTPVPVQPGDEVFAGSINGGGLLEIRTTQPADQTTLARIIQLVTQAQSRRSPSEQWVDRFARVYTPVVIGLAVLVAVVPPLVLSGAWEVWFYRALVLLVIACPCALVISTPVSIVAALARAARQGVLVKGGIYMEAPARIRAIAFDKTGTLTVGRPRVTQLVPLNGHSEEELLVRAAALEAGSNHPLARAIVEEAQSRRLAIPVVQSHQAIPGRGVMAELDGRTIWLGSHRLLTERKLADDERAMQLLDELSDAGSSVVAVGTDEHVCGLIALADQARLEATQALAELHRLGIRPIVMLTGDNSATARAIADELGIDEVHAELLPQDKVELVDRLVREHRQVAMVGDGINDAPALASATVGIAMGAAGSHAAIESADIALMTDDLARLPWLVRHARRTLGIIHQNIGFALGLKLLFVLLTFAGVATLWMAIAADTGASLLVIANALRLLRGRD